MELNTLSTLVKLVDKNWPITHAEYPELAAQITPAARAKFGISHVMRHQHKSIGVIESGLEGMEHGRVPELFVGQMALAAKKMFVNQLMLCVLLDISAEQLSEYVWNWARDKNPLSCPECGAQMEPVGTEADWRCTNCGAHKIAEVILHPQSQASIWGQKLKVGDTIKETDFFASSSGKWEPSPHAAGAVLQEACTVIWVRPVREQ